MNIPKDTREFAGIILAFVSLIIVMIAMFYMGYNQCTINVADRMHKFDDKGEECYTREEVDSFIYGERWTEVY